MAQVCAVSVLLSCVAFCCPSCSMKFCLMIRLHLHRVATLLTMFKFATMISVKFSPNLQLSMPTWKIGDLWYRGYRGCLARPNFFYKIDFSKCLNHNTNFEKTKILGGTIPSNFGGLACTRLTPTTLSMHVAFIQNMVGPGEVDEELESETAEECSKYGKVIKCLIFEVSLIIFDGAFFVYSKFVVYLCGAAV